MRRILLAFVLVAAACNPQPEHLPGQTATPTPAGAPPLRIESRGTAQQPLIFYGHKGNRTVYKMLASRAVANTAQGGGDGTFYDVTVTFYDPTGKTLQAKAPRAEAVEATGRLTLYGGVTATSSNGFTLRCKTLAYDRADGSLHGEGAVRITGSQGFETTGNRLDSDITFERLSLQ